MIFLLLTITVLSLYYFWIKWRYLYWKRQNVPGPEPSFPFGNIQKSILFQENFGMLCEQWYKENPDVPYVGFYKITEPAILLRDPDLIRDIVSKDFSSFGINDFPINKTVDSLLAEFAFFNTGDEWKRLRMNMVPIYSLSKIKSLIPSMESCAEMMVNYLKSLPKNEDVEARTLAAKFLTQNCIQSGFSIDAKCFEEQETEFREIATKIFQPTFLSGIKFVIAPLLPVWIITRLPISIVSSEVNNWFEKIVIENRKSRETIDARCNDILQFTLELQKKNNMTDIEVAGQMMALFIDGIETSSVPLSFVLYDLARNPDCQQRAYDEVVKILEKYDKKLSSEALQEMKYLNLAITESIRLNSVVMVNVKVATKPYNLPKLPNQKEPVTIPVGTTVTIPYKAIHYDPKYYPNPEEFIPERFTDEERKKRHNYVYMPFGDGQRACLGMRFALTQISVALVCILKNFVLTLSPNHKPFQVDPKTFMWYAKDGLLLHFTPRDL